MRCFMTERFCPNITKCPMFAYLERQDFRDCMNTYCLGNHQLCKRWGLRCNGEVVPEDMLPNGQMKADVMSGPPDDGSQHVRTLI